MTAEQVVETALKILLDKVTTVQTQLVGLHNAQGAGGLGVSY